MAAGDPSIYWDEVYNKNNIRITRAPNNMEFVFFYGWRKFIFRIHRKELYQIASSQNKEEKLVLLKDKLQKRLFDKEIFPLEKIIDTIEKANYEKAFDGENL